MELNEIEIRGKSWKMVPVNAIKPYERNAKIHSEQQIEVIRRSLRELGFVRPLLIDLEGNLLVGHGVLMAAKAEGMALVPCVVVEGLSEQERRAYVHIDNKLAEMSTWDQTVLDLDLRELGELGVDLTGLGFEEAPVVEPLDLDCGDGAEDDNDGDEKRTVMHCPKCGFVFEVAT